MAENPRIEELRRRVQADPASIAFAALAEEYRRTGRYDDAIKTCRTGLVRHPAYLSARVTLGRALIETGAYEAARVELETVLRSAPENIAARRGLEEIRDRAGQSKEMDPEVAALANPPARVAPPRAAEPVPAEPPVTAKPAPMPPAPSVSRAVSDLPLNPPVPKPGPDLRLDGDAFDMFAAALDKSVGSPEAIAPDAPAEPVTMAAPPAAPTAAPAPASAAAPAAPSVQVPAALAFDIGSISLEMPAAAPEPDPEAAVVLTRLEQFLGAIRTARHA